MWLESPGCKPEGQGALLTSDHPTKGTSFLELLTHSPKMSGSLAVPSRTHKIDISPTTSGHLYWSVRTALKTLRQKVIFS